MKRFVIYTGATQSYYGCTGDAKDLIKEQSYEVIKEIVKSSSTSYQLKGLPDEYESTWFKDIDVDIAISMAVPVPGKTCQCYIPQLVDNGIQLNGFRTSEVQEVYQMGKNIYQVITNHTMYMIKVIR